MSKYIFFILILTFSNACYSDMYCYYLKNGCTIINLPLNDNSQKELKRRVDLDGAFEKKILTADNLADNINLIRNEEFGNTFLFYEKVDK